MYTSGEMGLMLGVVSKGTLTTLVGRAVVGWVGPSHMGQFNTDMGLDWTAFVSVQAIIT
jgi:hypothetical protein